MHIKQHRYMERESVHEQTHTSQPTPFHTHPTSYAHTTHGPTELLLPVLPDGRVKLSSSQHPNTATLSHTRRESVHRVTNKTRASRGMSPNLPKSSPLVPKAESDHFGFKSVPGSGSATMAPPENLAPDEDLSSSSGTTTPEIGPHPETTMQISASSGPASSERALIQSKCSQSSNQGAETHNPDGSSVLSTVWSRETLLLFCGERNEDKDRNIHPRNVKPL